MAYPKKHVSSDPRSIMSKNWHKRVRIVADPTNRIEYNGGLPFRNTGIDIQRNNPCTCGSGKKFKKCCGGLKGEYPPPEPYVEKPKVESSNAEDSSDIPF